MKNLMIPALLAVFLLASPRAFAQRDSASALKRVETLRTTLSLTDEQTGKVNTIIFESMAEGKKAREAAGEDRSALMALRQEQMAKTDAKIEALLTTDQKKKFEEYKAERRTQMMNRRPDGR